MNNLWQDLRHSVRLMTQQPGFTAAAIVALALGIGANSAIFSAVNHILLRPLPYNEPDRIVVLWQHFQRTPAEQSHTAPPEFLDYQSQNQSFEHLAAYTQADVNLAGEGDPERVSALVASPDLYAVLGVQPIHGRVFLPDEAQPGRNLVALLSHGLWTRRFGSDPNVVGQTISVNGRNRTVVGIMPPGFRFPEESDLWLPLAFTPEQVAPQGRSEHFLNVIARLKPGVRIEQAEEDLRSIANQFPGGWITSSLVGLHDQFVERTRPALLVLWGAVGLVLLICCANVANLLLARAAGRRKEMAIRLALGAGRVRIVRQLLTESVLLSLLGGGFGLLAGMWGIHLLTALGPISVPGSAEIGLDARAIGFTLALSVLTGLAFGLAPALQASKSNLHEALKDGKGGTGDPRHRVRSILAISEIALALMLLIGAGLSIKSLVQLLKVDPGFNPENVLAVDISLPGARYSKAPQQVAFYQQLLQRVETLPGALYAGLISDLPLSGMNADRSFAYEGMPPEGSGVPTPGADYRHASPQYFQAMSIPLIGGRFFTDQDTQGTAGVAIVNQTLASHIWPGEDPIGKKVRFFARSGGMEDWLSVVGVVGDVRHHGLEAETRNEIYVPHFQTPTGTMTLVVRTEFDQPSLVGAVRAAVQATDKDQPIFNIRTLVQLYSDSVARPRLSALLLGAFAGVAVLLAAVGIYGVVSYSVTQRTREIGIRIALGAKPSAVMELVIRNGMGLALAGVAIGLMASLALTRVMETLLFGVSTRDEFTFSAVAVFLTLVTLLACYIPARRATKVDPMVALRYE